MQHEMGYRGGAEALMGASRNQNRPMLMLVLMNLSATYNWVHPLRLGRKYHIVYP
jgi:hypothetical protein